MRRWWSSQVGDYVITAASALLIVFLLMLLLHFAGVFVRRICRKNVNTFTGGDSPPSLLRSKAFYSTGKAIAHPTRRHTHTGTFTVEAYNQVTGVWSLLPPLSAPRAQRTATFVASR